VTLEIFLGIDIGSTTVKVVVLGRDRGLLAARYVRSQGQPRLALLSVMDDLAGQFDLSCVAGAGLTGSGGEPIARLIGGRHVNELVAQTCAVGHFHPEARTVVEMGGQDSKFMSVTWDGTTQRMVLVDFAMNSLCAAGTGAFLDQQAERLGISIETEFPAMAVQSNSPARIAGRCTVFAKSDMIHLQQKGTPLPDILAGLCLALARNFRSVIGKGKSFIPPVLFQGGVAFNQGVVRAFETILELKPGELIVPEHHTVMAALGTGYLAIEEADQGTLPAFIGFQPLADYVRSGQHSRKSMPPLGGDDVPASSYEAVPGLTRQPLPVYVGIDVGSISTNVVLIDEQAHVVARRYLLTAGRPLEAVRQGLAEVGQEVGDRVKVQGVGVTGSGRYLTGDYVGADIVRNEITAQARAAVAIDPTLDTVFEIGGQDSKFISLNGGAVVDFAMNSACAAGTGSFLEEQAGRLQIDIKEDFSRLAFSAAHPACLGERCTVFMESDLVHHQQQGAKLDELTGGLAYAIAQNYLSRVVNGRSLGRNIFFQGGVAWNQSVVAAFRKLTGRQITVPPHHDVTGAIGAAILTLETLAERRRAGDSVPTKFKGFDLADRRYETAIFECQACPNLCEISKIVIRGEPPIFYGARCDRFEEAGRKSTASAKSAALPDLFAEREALLLGDYEAPNGRTGRLRLAIPRALVFYDLFPYWRAFFDRLDVEIVLSPPTNPKVVSQTAAHAAVETCFPAKLMFGHVANLLEQDADLVFLPSVVNRESTLQGQTENNYCTYIPAMPHLVTAHLDFGLPRPQPLKLPFHMLWPKVKKKELYELGKCLGVSKRQVDAADRAAEAALHDFQEALRRRGREILDGLVPGQEAAVIVGRPYNTCDLGACQDLPFKLRKLGVLPIPMDFLPISCVDFSGRSGGVYWRGGQAILSASEVIRDDPRLQAIYVTNFNCGPDSFLLSFFRRTLGSKPFLELEFDDHTADAGVVTRCEAFFESLRMGKGSLA
jgi:predicted CoA-substrate-specific enzyme activase